MDGGDFENGLLWHEVALDHRIVRSISLDAHDQQALDFIAPGGPGRRLNQCTGVESKSGPDVVYRMRR